VKFNFYKPPNQEYTSNLLFLRLAPDMIPASEMLKAGKNTNQFSVFIPYYFLQKYWLSDLLLSLSINTNLNV